MIIWLTLLSCLAAVALLGVVAIDLVRICRALEHIGGTPQSDLAKIRFGVRAIESETAAIAPRVTALNQGLRALAEGLRAVDGRLGSAVGALKR